MSIEKIGNFYYTLFDNETAWFGRINQNLAVDSCNEDFIDKVIEIPSKVSNKGKQYKVTGIAFHAFYACEIKSVKIPSTITYIDASAFDLTHMEEDVVLPDSLEYISNWAFANAGLVNLHIPKNLKVIENGGFGCNENLKTITISENNTYFKLDDQGILYDSSFTTIIQAPAILNKITIPSSVKVIQAAAFSFTKITKLTIPRSVTTIYKQFVDCCHNLTSLYILGNVKFEEDRIGSLEKHTINLFVYQGVSPINCSNIFGVWDVENIVVCKGYKGGNNFATFNATINNHCQAYPYITNNEDLYNLDILACIAIVLYSK